MSELLYDGVPLADNEIDLEVLQGPLIRASIDNLLSPDIRPEPVKAAAQSPLVVEVERTALRAAKHRLGQIEQGRSFQGFNPSWVPPNPPARKLRQLSTVVQWFFRALGLWHLAHVCMAGGFMYYAVHWVTSQPCYNNVHALSPYRYNATGTDNHPGCVLDGGDAFYVLFDRQHWWKQGAILYAVFNGMTAAVSLLFSYFLYGRLLHLQPKSPKEVLHSMFSGFPAGSFMISYAWRDEPEYGYDIGALPRRVASFFPNSWLDIESLIPGTPVKETLEEVSRDALFRFAFVSMNYLASANCQTEWEQIRREPGKSFLFVYPTLPYPFVRELEDEGHFVVVLSDAQRRAVSDPDWFVSQLVRSRLCNTMFCIKSPAVNDEWLPSLRYWYGHPDCSYLKLSLPLMFGTAMTIAIDIFCYEYYNFWVLFLKSDGTEFLYICSMILPLLLFLMSIYVIWYLRGTGFEYPGLPDVAYLLMFMHRIGMIDPIRMFSNSDRVFTAADVAPFMASGVAERTMLPEDADIKIILLDNVQQGDFETTVVDASWVFWASVSFDRLAPYCRQRFGSVMIGDGVPTMEFLGCKILMKLFNVPARDLHVGKNGFRTLFKHHEQARTRLRRCLNLFSL